MLNSYKILKILLVEDDPGDVDLILEMLKGRGMETSAFSVEPVKRLSEALVRLKDGDIDVVLVDLGLPDSSGLDTFHRLNAAAGDAPIILLTGNTYQEAAVTAVKEGAQDFLIKGQISGGLIVRAILYALERKRAEEERRKSEKKYKDLFDSTLDGIYQVDADGIFVMMNRAGARIFGYENPEDIIGRNALEFWRDPKDRAAFRAELEMKKTVNAYHMKARNKSGKPIELESSSLLREDEKGNFLGIDGILRDVTGRMQTEKRIHSQIQKLSALHTIDLAISASVDIRMTLSVFLEQVMTQLHVDACDVLLLNPHVKTLEYAVGSGFRTNSPRHTQMRLGQGYAGIAALENRMVRVPNITRDDNAFKQLGALEGENFVTYYGVPLVAKGQVKGVLEVFHRSLLESDEEWLDFLEALALQAAIAIDSNSLFQDLERSNMGLALAYDSTIEGWSRALDYRDKETQGHSHRVTEMTEKIAREMRMSEEELMHVRWGALLHDIGKMGIPDNILLKPGPLTDEEWKIMRLHPVYAYELLQPIDYLRSALDIPYCHHEKWDGTGYSRGLKGEQIPLSARIFAVVDVWDALRSDRPYRPAWPREKTLEHIRQLAGTHFDPNVVEVFLRFLASENP